MYELLDEDFRVIFLCYHLRGKLHSVPLLLHPWPYYLSLFLRSLLITTFKHCYLYSQVYIITDVRRDSHFHTEYRLTQYANHEKHRWERLKRSARKTGTDFRITCRSFTM